MGFKLINTFLTPSTHYKRISFFDPENGNKKKIQIVIDALVISLGQPANRASSGVLVENFDFWGNAGDQKKQSKRSLLKGSGFANGFPDPHVKQMALAGRLENECRIGTSSTAADGDDITS
jgi:hypothetical protein